ncbi:MAG: DUF4362 domain-containing protein [Terrisporobacter othiniensis]|uniref:Lipoprotein n=1 Tax=Terrisporobacter othiniensis TaxID=1577792 RepID=A0A0B3WTH3_9FIRM|nr:DUF4362 domain-containing protein [Terrisporobacter othiniensis]KHS57875.1 hypothetical protein QX51_05845 [Terrisporobacter othiniensis]MDU6983070.1 DUF4362 domain-containing protein [Terrisporobacter othiniensis]
MKKIISIIICIIFFSLIGCENIDNENIINTFNDKELKVYSSEDSQKVKDLLKSYGDAKNLTVEEAKKNNIVVVENEQIVGNKKIWNDFYNNSKNNKDGSILIVQYTEQDDPILTYLSCKDKEFFMIEDDSRDQYRDNKNEDYFEYSFKYLKLFEENKKTYVYLLDDNKITLDELNYSLLSSNISDWIPYGFVFYYINT